MATVATAVGVAIFHPALPPRAAAATPEFELLAEIRLPNTAADWINVPVTVAGSTVFVADDSRIYYMGVDQLALDDTLTLPSSAGTVTPTAATTLGGKAFFAYRTRQVVAVDATTKAVTVIPAVCGAGVRIVPWMTTYADRVYVGCDTANFVARIDPVTLTVDDTFATGNTNKGMVVVDDTAYITNDASDSVTPVDLRTDPPTPAATISVGDRPHGIASYDDTVFVANFGGVGTMSVIKTATPPSTTATLNVGSQPVPVVSCGAGIYTARRGTSEVMVVNPVTQAIQSINSTAFSDPHALATYQDKVWVLSINHDRVATIDCDTNTVDDSVSLSGAADWPVSMAFSPYRTFVTSVGGSNGHLAVIKTGTPPPTPTPPTPPSPASPPLEPQAIGMNRSAAVTWTAPESSGSYSITHYLVSSSPAGRTCLVPSAMQSCSVPGLSNGTSYTFTVKALTGAGWSLASTASNAVVPTEDPPPSLVITGSRIGKRLQVSGASVGVPAGTALQPWMRHVDETEFHQGAARPQVDVDGDFTWTRRSGIGLRIYFMTADGALRSNAITIR